MDLGFYDSLIYPNFDSLTVISEGELSSFTEIGERGKEEWVKYVAIIHTNSHDIILI